MIHSKNAPTGNLSLPTTAGGLRDGGSVDGCGRGAMLTEASLTCGTHRGPVNRVVPSTPAATATTSPSTPHTNAKPASRTRSITRAAPALRRADPTAHPHRWTVPAQLAEHRKASPGSGAAPKFAQ